MENSTLFGRKGRRGRGGGGMFPSVSTLLSLIVAPQNSTMYCVYLLIFFFTGLVRGILSGVAVDVGSDIAKQSDPSNGSQKSKAMTLL